MKIRIVFTGRGYDAGAELPPQLELPAGATTVAALQEIRRRLPADRDLPPSCLVAVQGRHLGTVGGHAPRELRDGEELVLIAPVAGG